MSVSLGQAIIYAFENKDDDNTLVNAVSIVGTLWRNAASTAETVTLTVVETGIYSAAFTIPSNWTVGDSVQLRIISDGESGFVWIDFITSTSSGSGGTFLDAI